MKDDARFDPVNWTPEVRNERTARLASEFEKRAMAALVTLRSAEDADSVIALTPQDGPGLQDAAYALTFASMVLQRRAVACGVPPQIIASDVLHAETHAGDVIARERQLMANFDSAKKTGPVS